MTGQDYRSVAAELNRVISAILGAVQEVLKETARSRGNVASRIKGTLQTMPAAEAGSLLSRMILEMNDGSQEQSATRAARTAKPAGFSISGHQMIGVQVTDGDTTVSVGVEPSEDLSGIKGGGIRVEHRY